MNENIFIKLVEIILFSFLMWGNITKEMEDYTISLFFKPLHYTDLKPNYEEKKN